MPELEKYGHRGSGGAGHDPRDSIQRKNGGFLNRTPDPGYDYKYRSEANPYGDGSNRPSYYNRPWSSRYQTSGGGRYSDDAPAAHRRLDNDRYMGRPHTSGWSYDYAGYDYDRNQPVRKPDLPPPYKPNQPTPEELDQPAPEEPDQPAPAPLQAVTSRSTAPTSPGNSVAVVALAVHLSVAAPHLRALSLFCWF